MRYAIRPYIPLFVIATLSSLDATAGPTIDRIRVTVFTGSDEMRSESDAIFDISFRGGSSAIVDYFSSSGYPVIDMVGTSDRSLPAGLPIGRRVGSRRSCGHRHHRKR